jgi:hypothetical protein
MAWHRGARGAEGEEHTMPTATFDQPRADQHLPAPRPPRRRRTTALVVSMLVVLAIGAGTILALASRPASTAATAQPSASTAAAPAPAPATPARQQPAQAAQPSGTATATGPAVLADGDHNAYIRRVDTRRDRIVVDVVQLFEDDAAVEAAIQDGRSRENAQYLTTYLRNQSRRLRTLPLADNLVVDLLSTCDEPEPRGALLARLAKNAAAGDLYYYRLRVKDGAVWRIEERLATPAC